MKPLLVIHSSGRFTRSITRHLTRRFVDRWRSLHPDAEIVERDVALGPPPPVNEAWIAAAFAPPAERTPEMNKTLATSDVLIDELIEAEAIVIGAPMYNFGMPAVLKAYVDQIVRVGRTFAFHPGEEEPYQPLVPSKPLILITANGAGGYEPGGPYAHLNFLEPHLSGVFQFIGISEVLPVRVGFEEHKDRQFQDSLAAAELAVDEIALHVAAKNRIQPSEPVTA